MMQPYKADLHIHTCLSPCADLDMLPQDILQAAARQGLDVIGICDHNAAANVPAVLQAAGDSPVRVIPGMEITTREEVHILGLFQSSAAVLDIEQFVQTHLQGQNDAEIFGHQLVVDAEGTPLELCSHLLIGATDLSLTAVVDAIHERSGCAIAAHVDRQRFSLVGQLGFVPPNLALDGLEHSPRIGRQEACRQFGACGRWEFICNSDAHRLSEVGAGSSMLHLESPTADELRRALCRQDGRSVLQ